MSCGSTEWVTGDKEQTCVHTKSDTLNGFYYTSWNALKFMKAFEKIFNSHPFKKVC